MIRLVTFDLDDTLWNTAAVIGPATVAMRTWLLANAPEYARFDEADMAAVRDQALASRPQLRHDISELRLACLRIALARCGYAPPDAARLAAGAFEEFLDWRHRVTFFSGALEMLGRLRQDYILAALTDGNAHYAHPRLGLDRFFSFGYCAADVGAAKPHPAMFERALARAGVAPQEAVHVGDNAERDVQGAADVGMASIWVKLHDSDDDPPATRVVTRLDQIPAAIARLG